MADTKNNIKYSRASASLPALREVLHCKCSQQQIFTRGRQLNNIFLPPVKETRKVQDIFVERDKNKAPAYLVMQHWGFGCLCGAGEGACGGAPGARVRTDGWDVFEQMRRQKGMPRHKGCLSEHPRTDWLCLASALLSLSGK